MFIASYQGMLPFGEGYYKRHNPYGHSHIGYQAPVGYQPGFYPTYGGIHHFHPSLNTGYGFPSYSSNQDYFIPQGLEHAQIEQGTNKQYKSPIKHHEYHWHHGYPFGQGSGMFPDYYHSNY